MLLSTAVASAGRILSLSPPSTRSSYTQIFIGPYIRCEDANSTEVMYIDAFQQNRNAALQDDMLHEELGFYAFVPSFDAGAQNNNTIYLNDTALTALEQPRLQQVPRNATNEIWLKYYRYRNETLGDPESWGVPRLSANGSKIPEAKYSVCRLWNTTYSVNVTFENGVQTVQDIGLDSLHVVGYPAHNPSQPSDLAQIAYTGFMSVITDQMVGSMGLVISTAKDVLVNSSYSSVDTPLAHTSLIGSRDLDYAFDLNQAAQGTLLSNASMPRRLSDQRLQDKLVAQNHTLPFLIEQLSFNTTVSLMTAPLLSSVSTKLTAQSEADAQI